MMTLTATSTNTTPNGAAQWDLSSDAARTPSSALPLTQSAFENASAGGAKSREMVWQRSEAGPLGKLLESNPDFAVLIVNEAPATRKLIRSVLLAFGVSNIHCASSAVEAMEFIKRDRPDIALIDQSIADTSGIAFTNWLRQDAASPAPKLPIIMLASVTEKAEILELQDAGVTEIIAKPFAPDALARHIAAAILNERTFIRSESFCGPDRRRGQRPFSGTDRRISRLAEVEINRDIYWV